MQLYGSNAEPQSPGVERGVYWAHARKNGRPVCYCVDSKGNERRRYVVMHDARCEAAIEALWVYLDLIDPVRHAQLRLVTDAPTRDLPSTARKSPFVVFDPYEQGPLPWGHRKK